METTAMSAQMWMDEVIESLARMGTILSGAAVETTRWRVDAGKTSYMAITEQTISMVVMA